MRLRTLSTFLISLAVACDSFPPRPKTDFSGEQALAYAQAQVSLGPRVPGTPAHEKAGDWIVAQMRTRTDTVVVQSFTYKALDGRSIPMRNILARF
jgi:glutaminyl-peptide cyclotransferase